MREQFPYHRGSINAQERAFFKWWDKIEPYKSRYNLRMAFDAGYEAAMQEREGE